MLYITVPSVMRPAEAQAFLSTWPTFIDYYADYEDQGRLEIIQAAMSRLGGSRYLGNSQDSPWYVCTISQPPHQIAC